MLEEKGKDRYEVVLELFQKEETEGEK